MATALRINYIELPANDLQAVKAFYTTAFGWTFVDYGPDYTSFNDGDFDGGFYRAELASTTSTGAALVVLFTLNLEEALQRVQAAGGALIKDIFAFPGGRRFHFSDPAGNELAVWSDR